MTFSRRRRFKGAHSRNDGFLLAEALVTMAIGAFLLIALISLVQMMVRTNGRSADIARQIEATSRAIDAMGRDLRPAVRARWGGKGSAFVFTGTALRLQLAIRDSATGSLRLVVLAVNNGSPNTVLRSSTEFPAYAQSAADMPDGPAPIELYSGRFFVRFAYFAPLKDNVETLADGWDQRLAMPAAVRVSFADPTTGALVSSVRIPLMINAEPGCASPRRGICSYVETGEADALDEADLPPESVDASDPLGWMRYAK